MKTAFAISSVLAAGALALGACAPTQDAATPPASGPNADFKPCRVADYQRYVGQNRSTVPTAPQGQVFRVLCTTCPATMDYRENRVTFVFDEATNIIRDVKCG